MDRRLICILFLALSGLEAYAQLTVFPAIHDFGLLRRTDPNWVDVKITNHDLKEAFIFRVEGSTKVNIQMSSKKILSDSTVYIRIQYNPTTTGHFREELRIYASSWQQPKAFVISGESTYAVDSSLPCPDFSILPAASVRTIHITAFDQSMSERIAGVKTVLYRDGRKYTEAISDANGEIELNLIPGRHFISFTQGNYSGDTTLYIHGFNQHIELLLPEISKSTGLDTTSDVDIVEPDRKTKSGATNEMANYAQTSSVGSYKLETNILTSEFKPNNIVFLVDVSTSMKHEGKLELLKIAMVELLEVLRPIDRFTLISYATDTQVLIETRSQLDKSACILAIQTLTAGGGTEGAKAIDDAGRKALQHAIHEGNNQIIIATDGAFNEGALLAKKLALKYQRKGIVISVLGIKCGKYATAEMSDLATYGGGRFVAINNPTDAVDKLVDEIKVSSRN